VEGGLAPIFRESALDAPEMRRVFTALQAILKQQEPFPGVVLDRSWNVLMTNRVAHAFFSCMVPQEVLAPPVNLIELVLARGGLRPYLRNLEDVIGGLAQRIQREAVGGLLDRQAAALLDSLRHDPGYPRTSGSEPDASLPFIPVEFQLEGRVFRFFSVVTTLGTPADVTAEELRIECFFPADDFTACEMPKLV
jgi:hypothetical protein